MYAGSPALSDTTIKAYFKPKDGGEVEAVRVDMDTIKSIEQLYTVLRDEFELEENVAFRIKYLVRSGPLGLFWCFADGRRIATTSM